MAEISYSMDPLSAGVGALGSIVGAWQQNRMIKKQIAAQREENEKTRQYNLMLARQQNAWNIEQWEREMDYNNVSNQRERLRKAGMNPDIAYSGLPGDNLAPSSPVMSSGAAAVSADMSPMANYQSAGSITTQALQNALIAANIKKVNAEAENTGVDTAGKKFQNVIYKADASVAEQLAQGKLQLQHSQIELNYSGSELNVEDQFRLKRQCRLLDKSIVNAEKEGRKMEKEIESMSLDNFMKEIEKRYKDGYWQSMIKNLNSSTLVNDANVRTLLETLEGKKTLFDNQGNYYDKLRASEEIKNDILDIMRHPVARDIGDVKSYGELEQFLNYQTYRNNRHAKGPFEWLSWRMQNIDDAIFGRE